MSKTLKDLQATVEELRKLGAFTEEDLTYLTQLEMTVDELKEKVGAGLNVKLKNHGQVPDPKLQNGMITLYANIYHVEFIQPKDFMDVSTGIEIIELPENVNLFIEPHVNVHGVFSSRMIHPNLGNSIVITLCNFSNSTAEIYPGAVIGKAYFQSTLNENFVNISTVRP